MPGPRIVRADALARAKPSALARLLAPFAAFFAAGDVDVASLGAATQVPRAIARRIATAAHDPRAPAPLRALLGAFDSLADPRGAAELVRLDVARRLPRATLGDEDLALFALLDAPDLADRALVVSRAVRAARDPARAYTDYEPSGGPVAYEDVLHAKLEERLAGRFEARDSARYSSALVSDTEEATLFEIAHGDRPRTREIVDTRALALALVTDTSAHRAYAVLDKKTGWLSVAAHAPAVKDLVRRAFGEVLAGDEAYFRAGEIYDLGQFSDLREALSVEHVPGLCRVEVHALTVATPKGVLASFSRAREDLLGGDATDIVRAAIAAGAIVGIRLYLSLQGREQKSKVEITAKDGRNVVEMDREDTELAAVVRAYLLARGVLRRAPLRKAGEAQAESRA